MAKKNFFIDLTLHNFSADVLQEFAVKVVKPYFSGNINQALRALMDKAIEEENLFKETVINTKTKTVSSSF